MLWPRADREGDEALLDRLLAEELQMIGPDGAQELVGTGAVEDRAAGGSAASLEEREGLRALARGGSRARRRRAGSILVYG